MTAPNRNALWGRILIEELAAAGLESVCLTPGSRCTPLTVAVDDHDDLDAFSHLDERSSAYFALGRARRTGEPVGLVCTSGTAAANYHPAVLEADRGRVPLVLLTADRPPLRRDSGANQTTDQVKLYGDAVRWFRELPRPEPDDRTLRRLRVDACRAVATATGTPAGPVHLNVPFRKPLEPVDVPGDIPDDLSGPGAQGRLDVDERPDRDGRHGAFVEHETGTVTPPDRTVARIAAAVAEAERVLLVAGPSDPPPSDGGAIVDLAAATGAPLLADPLSGARFGHTAAEEQVAGRGSDSSGVTDGGPLVCGGYDAYLATDATDSWAMPEVVVRVGASPTSKSLRAYLADTDARQVLVDSAGDWREAEFVASDLVTAAPDVTARALADAVRERSVDPDAPGRADYRSSFADAEAAHWSLLTEARTAAEFEGAVIPAILESLPTAATLFASNSMPVRDLDRFGAPRGAAITALANRGVSGIDGITSTALGAASAADEPLVAVVGDLAYYHDTTGLLAATRCGVDATVVLVNNDGGGIFHALPIEDFDPPFTEAFKTPHGLDFEPTGDLYDLSFERVDDLAGLRAACESSVGSDGLDVVEIEFDAEASHSTREALRRELEDALD